MKKEISGSNRFFIILIILILLVTLGFEVKIKAQSTISGTIMASEDGIPMEGVAVSSHNLRTGVLTDYKGRYTLKVGDNDTIQFSYLGYKEQKFPIQSGWNTYYTLNVSMEILPIVLKNLNYVQSRNFKDDSLNYRAENKYIFEYKYPFIAKFYLGGPPHYVFGDVGPYFSGHLGINIESIYLRLKGHNIRTTRYRKLLEKAEKSSYVHNSFNPQIVSQITGLKGEDLHNFMKNYEPKFIQVYGKSDYDINSQIKEAYLKFKSKKESSVKMN